MFNFTLRYNKPAAGATALFNGNISQTHWNTLNTDSSTKTYSYSYDHLNRIVSAIDNTGKYNLNSVDYDKNENILALQRQGHLNPDATAFGLMDDLTYTYNSGNQLLKVADASGVTEGFKDGNTSGDDYTYDVNGNMISDKNKGITDIWYNHLNLPVGVRFEDDSSISYKYDATGVKMSKFLVNETTGEERHTSYAGSFVYENNVLQFFATPVFYDKNK
ncbi:MAG: hypothetical protein GKR88_08610 [Flavobacteriaceae bacterium]|nr:MAG: hypothetical protein GKR88_08610 [Flavobacteriaceae bacterium]